MLNATGRFLILVPFRSKDPVLTFPPQRTRSEIELEKVQVFGGRPKRLALLIR